MLTRRLLPDIILSALVLLLQTTVVEFLAVHTIVPDLVLIWIVVIALRRGQIPATVAGFSMGLVQDLVSGPDGMLGLSALTKTIAGFLAGYFYAENKTPQILGSYRLLLITGIVSLVHNALYFVLFLQGSGIRWTDGILSYGLPSTAYTVAVALIPMLVFARKQVSSP